MKMRKSIEYSTSFKFLHSNDQEEKKMIDLVRSLCVARSFFSESEINVYFDQIFLLSERTMR